MTAVGVALLQYGGQELGWAGLVAGAAAVALLVPSVPRLLPPGTLRLGRGLPTTVALRGLLAGGFFGAEAFLPLMLNSERGLSLALGGLALTGAAIGWSVGSWFQGHSDLEIARWLLVRRGAVLTVVGVALVASTVSDAVPPAVAGIGWLVGGFGMGVAMPSISIVLFELSPVEDQGANSAALQVCDALASTFFIGVGGVIFAAGHTTAGEDADVFLAVFAVMTAVLVVAVFAAGRMAVRHPAPVPVGAARPNEETSGAAERACH